MTDPLLVEAATERQQHLTHRTTTRRRQRAELHRARQHGLRARLAARLRHLPKLPKQQDDPGAQDELVTEIAALAQHRKAATSTLLERVSRPTRLTGS